jgi:hypothetical protein
MLLSSDERSLCKAKGPAARPPAADKSLSGVVTQGSCMVPLYLPPDSVSDFGTCRLAIAYVSVNRLSARPPGGGAESVAAGILLPIPCDS